jgi:hypothetical protein
MCSCGQPSGTKFRDRFGLRDLYSFGTFFPRLGCPLPPRGVDILLSLERNFNGVPPAEFNVGH